jgi:hypothetical protein
MNTGCEVFEKWCRLNDLAPMPAAPATVARFVSDISAMGIEKIWPMIGEISRAHYLIGLADPTLGGAVSAAINAIAKIEPPQSWPAPLRLRFQTLPYDLQAYLAMQEKEQRRVISKALNEAAEARKAIQKPEREDHGISESAA